MEKKQKLLLHSCCAPCSSYVISFLKNDYDITVLFYNPNITDKNEYEKRKNEQMKLLSILDIDFFENENPCDGEYNSDLFYNQIKGLENEKEGGERCVKCFALRLHKSAETAKQNKYDVFATTLSVSPHKNAKTINEIGNSIEKELNIKYLEADFKKNDGYKKSIELSKKYDLYRQNYCGCIYSMRNSERGIRN